MPQKTKTDLTKEAIIEALERDRPASLTALARGLGYSGSVSSWLRNKLLELIPDLTQRLRTENAPAKAATKGKARTAKPKSKAKVKGKTYPRHESNRFREGSSYATAYDVLAGGGEKGMPRADLVKEVARLTGKDERRAYFDCVVVCSPREDGSAHRSADKAADAYWVRKEPGGNVALVLRDRKY